MSNIRTWRRFGLLVVLLFTAAGCGETGMPVRAYLSKTEAAALRSALVGRTSASVQTFTTLGSAPSNAALRGLLARFSVDPLGTPQGVKALLGTPSCASSSGDASDADGDGVPANLRVVYTDCHEINAAGDTMRFSGRLTARDEHDTDAASGFDLTRQDFEIEFNVGGRSSRYTLDLTAVARREEVGHYALSYTEASAVDAQTSAVELEAVVSAPPVSASASAASGAGLTTLDAADLEVNGRIGIRNDSSLYALTVEASDLRAEGLSHSGAQFVDGTLRVADGLNVMTEHFRPDGTSSGTYNGEAY
jgi:hypothetical protein